jgi:hypothetical protein
MAGIRSRRYNRLTRALSFTSSNASRWRALGECCSGLGSIRLPLLAVGVNGRSPPPPPARCSVFNRLPSAIKLASVSETCGVSRCSCLMKIARSLMSTKLRMPARCPWRWPCAGQPLVQPLPNTVPTGCCDACERRAQPLALSGMPHPRNPGSTFRLALLSSPFSLATSFDNLKRTVPATCNAERDLRHKISIPN